MRNSRGPSSSHSALLVGISGSLAMLISSCLKVNTDYDFDSQASPPIAESTRDQSTEPVGTDQVSTPTETTTQAPSSTSTGEESSTSLTANSSDTATSSNSSSTSSDTASEFPVDTNDGVWTPIKFTLDARASAPAPVGYSMQAWVAHDAIVSQGGDPEGKDLALVYVQGGVGRNLDRWRDPTSTWNHSQTRLWFKSQQALKPGEEQNDVYYLVRGSSVFKPKDDPQQIFLLYDNFKSGSFRPQAWQDVNEAVGNSSIVSTADGISLEVSAPGSQQQRRSLRSLWSQPLPGILAETRYRIPTSVNQPCNHMVPLAFESSSDNRVWQGLGLDSRQWKRAVYTSGSQSELQFNNISNAAPAENGAWHRYALTWFDNKAEIWRDGVLIDLVENLSQGVSRPSQQAIQLRLAAHAQPGGCTGASRSQIEFDWIWLRSYAEYEPRSSF